MEENKIVKRRGIALRTPEDARRLIRRIVDKAFAEGAELEYSGRLAQLLGVWCKFWELEHVTDLEKRIKELEEARDERHSQI